MLSSSAACLPSEEKKKKKKQTLLNLMTRSAFHLLSHILPYRSPPSPHLLPLLGQFSCLFYVAGWLRVYLSFERFAL
jgi:hypothetical protein